MSLPAHFPIDDLSPANRRKVRWFYERYVESYYQEYRLGHFLLAAYAAVPALLTPDLLYKLWQNFHLYQWAGQTQTIHRIAVSDILLSPLCREVGYELYEMETPIRHAFLQWLEAVAADPTWQERQLTDIDHLAAFVLEYHKKPNPGHQRWGNPYGEIQEWNALALTQPDRLQQQIWQKLQQSVALGQETETLRLLDLWSKADQQVDIVFRKASDTNALDGFRQNATFAQAWKALLQHYTDAFTEAIAENPDFVNMLDDNPQGGIAVQMPARVKVALEEKKSENQKRKETVRAVLIGVDNYQHSVFPTLNGCANDVRDIYAVLTQAAEYLEIDFQAELLLNQDATIARVRKSLREIQDLQSGDSLVFFFAGHSSNALYAGTSQADATLFFYDSSPGELPAQQKMSKAAKRAPRNEPTGLSQLELENAVYELIRERAVSCLFILDQPILPVDRRERLLSGPLREPGERPAGGLIILYGADEAQSTYERVFGQESRGVFPYALTQVYRERGMNTPFDQLIDMTRLRMTQLIENQTPTLEAFPPELSRSILFALTPSTGPVEYQIRYDETYRRFVLPAGSRQGITPSLEFMHTLLELEDGRLLVVGEVLPLISFIQNFTGDGDDRSYYPAKLRQLAIPKVTIAFDPQADKRLQDQLEKVMGNYDINYINIGKIEEAQYFIHTWQDTSTGEEHYFLARQTTTEKMASNEIKPLFNLEPDPFELIRQMEYIAQWSGVLEYRNTSQQLERDDLLIEVELFDGVPASELENPEGVPTVQALRDPESLALHFYDQDINTSTQSASSTPDYRSALRVRVTNTAKQPLFVKLLYLDSTYGIHPIGEVIELLPNSGRQVIRMSEPSELIFIDFTLKYLELSITEIFDYLKFFIATQPIDTYPLEQESLQLDRETTRTTISRGLDRKGAFSVGEAEWMTVTIPLKIIYQAQTASGAAPEAEAPFEEDFSGSISNQAPEVDLGEVSAPPSYRPQSKAPPAPEEKADRGATVSIAEIREMVARADIKQALDALRRRTAGTELENEVILLLGRYTSLERDNLRAVISQDEYSRSLNRITYSVLQLLNQLDEPIA